MQDYFRELSRRIISLLSGKEVLLLYLEGERSDFVRLNNNRIRQIGHVAQQILHVTLIERQRQSTASLDLAMDMLVDEQQAGNLLTQMREQLIAIPEDPYVNYSTSVCNSEYISESRLPTTQTALEQVMTVAEGLDLVGLWAGGEVCRGFANSLGQFNWHTSHNFNFNWSVYSHADKAVKQNYAGAEWDERVFMHKINYAKEILPLLKAAPKTLSPGYYPAYIAPNALKELTDLLGWSSFGLKAHRTAQTPLLKMIEQGTTLDASVRFVEQHTESMLPQFTSTGFMKPAAVNLIVNGAYQECLASARTAREYDVPVNCDVEQPQSLSIAAGNLSTTKVLSELGTGIYISDLWYSNYSDRNNCRITGMTRFACLWVEAGRPVAPLKVMRFDDSIYHILGDNLVGLTIEQEKIIDSGSYEKRSQSSVTLPGVLVSDLHLTL